MRPGLRLPLVPDRLAIPGHDDTAAFIHQPQPRVHSWRRYYYGTPAAEILATPVQGTLIPPDQGRPIGVLDYPTWAKTGMSSHIGGSRWVIGDARCNLARRSLLPLACSPR
jgi:hypothetical protein